MDRVVHFTNDELRWECNTWEYSQGGPIVGKFSPKFDPEEFENKWCQLWRLNYCYPASLVGDAYRLWQHMVMFYTRRRQTEKQDWLAALLELAQQLGAVART